MGAWRHWRMLSGLGLAVLTAGFPACGTTEAAHSPTDGGSTDSSNVVDTSSPDQAAPDAQSDAPQDDANDAAADVQTALAPPTFTPSSGTTVGFGATVTINPPSGLPPSGQVFYTTNGTVPTPGAETVYMGPIQITATTVINAVATAPGYVDSAVASATYPFQPICSGETPVLEFNPTSTTSWSAFHVALTVNGLGSMGTFCCESSSLVDICYTLDGSTPTVDANGQCSGSTKTYDAATGVSIGPTAANGEVTLSARYAATATGCYESSDGIQPVAPVEKVYQLVLAPPFLSSTNSVATGQPGWAWATSGAPATAMLIPADAGVPYGPFVAQQVGDPACTGVAGAPEPMGCTGTPYQLADFICWSTTAPATCDCPDPISLSAATPYATLPGSADVSPGDTLSSVACQTSPPTNAAGVYATSAITAVQF